MGFVCLCVYLCVCMCVCVCMDGWPKQGKVSETSMKGGYAKLTFRKDESEKRLFIVLTFKNRQSEK